MPDPWATYKCPSASQAKVSNLLSAYQESFQLLRKVPWKTKAVDEAATTHGSEAWRAAGEIETTGKHAPEDEERFQKMKEEAWSSPKRQPGFQRKTRNEFEEEFSRKVRNVMGNSKGEQEKAVQKWSSEMQRAIQLEERRREARRERQWNKKTRTLKDNEHGRNYGDRGSRPIATGLTVSSGAWCEFAMCASSDEKVYEFSVPIQSGRYHMVGEAARSLLCRC